MIVPYFFPNLRKDDVDMANQLIQDGLLRMEEWSNKWKVKFKATKSMEELFSPSGKAPRNHPILTLSNDSQSQYSQTPRNYTG
jgi:hypothetical protein